jgi:glycosyltransferase involved in cell wall biosynthesis
MKQTYPHIEIIVVDDASTDQTRRVVQKWIQTSKVNRIKGRKVVLIPLPRNLGFAGAVTTGMFATRGEFIAFQDSDDLSHPKRIQKQVQYLRKHPNIDLVGTKYAAFKDGNFRDKEIATWIQYGEQIRKTYAEGGHCVCHSSTLFRGSVFDRLGGETRRMNGDEDYEFIAKCISNGVGIENIPEVLYYYRSHPAQRSRAYYG